MIHQLFKIGLLISCLISFSSGKSSYEKEKGNIMTLISGHKGSGVKITRIVDFDINISISKIQSLDASTLIDELNAEYSLHFLIIFLFGCAGGRRPILIFPNVKSLYPLRDEPQERIPLKRIFKNFRIFLLGIFENVKANSFMKSTEKTECCTNSSAPISRYEILEKFEILWYNKLEPLAKRLLRTDEYIYQSKLTKDKIDFLHKLLDRGVEFMLLQEYKRLYEDIQNKGVGKSPVVKNFLFLAAHFVAHLNDFDSLNFLSKFEWLASQDAGFIVDLFYFEWRSWLSERVKTSDFGYFLQRDVEGMVNLTKVNIKRIRKASIDKCLEVIEIDKLANIILKKVARVRIQPKIKKSSPNGEKYIIPT